jgi:hypothetical protein
MIQSGFNNVPNLRLIYCEGILELMGIGKAHEMYTSRTYAKEKNDVKREKDMSKSNGKKVYYLRLLSVPAK